ncbi:hypothetical protein A9Q81_24600 [Gammaproteobacteria bacterium 42_54_T18]|nr:hypothetical protein A9Q81_24600 [Gammaproteobacteria bacterium 42_54_T18]
MKNIVESVVKHVVLITIALSLQACGGGGSGEVTKPANQAPVVKAGGPQSITLPENSVNLAASVKDDGVNTVLWTLKSGTGSVIFSDASALNTSADFSNSGVYTLTLIVNDGDFVVSDDIVITVNDISNQAPVVVAGDDQSITLPENSVSLAARVNDDGDSIALWTLKSGTGSVIFTDDSVVNTSVEFSDSGIYTLRLTVDDGEFIVSDDVIVTVNDMPNQAPVVVVGEDQSITLPNSNVNLVASIKDDGDFSVLWTQTAGKVRGIFADDTAVNTSAELSENGIYTFRLTVDDGEFVVSDDVIVTVTSNIDSFGITKFYPTATGFTDWQSTHWHNGNGRTISNGRDPEDVTAWSQKRGDDDLNIDGNGILVMGGGNQPRLYINPYPESDEVNPEQFFKNVEATVYYQRIGNDGAANGGLVIGLRSGPNGHSIYGDYCDATTYYARLRHDGYADFYKELKHNEGKAEQQIKLYTSGVLPSQQWLGMKFIAYNINNDSQVKLELYIDNTSDGDVSNGGEWTLVAEMIDEGDWRVAEDVSSCTYSDNHIITTGGGAVIIRNSGVDSAEYKYFSVREIDSSN